MYAFWRYTWVQTMWEHESDVTYDTCCSEQCLEGSNEANVVVFYGVSQQQSVCSNLTLIPQKSTTFDTTETYLRAVQADKCIFLINSYDS